MLYRSLILQGLILLLMTSCASWKERPDTVIENSTTHAVQISMLPSEFKEGDTVQSYHHSCLGGGPVRGRMPYSCHDNITGTGAVIKIIKDDRALVQFSSTDQVEEGNYVQRR